MEKIYISDLKKHLNQDIISDFLIVRKELRSGAKDQYLRLEIADKTGSMIGNIWSNAEVFNEAFAEGDVLRIKAKVISYKNQLQLNISKIDKLYENEYDLADFMETTSKDINSLSAKFFQFVDRIKEPQLKNLLLLIFEDKGFFTKFAQAPAAKTWHHNYLGGLLEHTVSIAQICEFVSNLYQLDKDLLIAGALLHDIGKVFEYDNFRVIDFTVEGRLIGHITLGDQLVCSKAREINNFPPVLLMKLRHLILSHHGEYEKASARLPQMLEAVVLHHADNLDAQTVGVLQTINRPVEENAQWSEFDRLNERYYFLK